MIVPTCRELIEFLDDYTAGRLALPKRLTFELHLALCRDCRNYLSSYRRTVELAKEVREADDSSPPPMPEDLVKAILEAMKQGNDGQGAG